LQGAVHYNQLWQIIAKQFQVIHSAHSSPAQICAVRHRFLANAAYITDRGDEARKQMASQFPLNFPNPVIRLLGPKDKPATVRHFLRLDDETRHHRFQAAISDTLLIKHAVTAFKPGNLLLGAFVNGTLRAVGELRRLDTHNAEVAFSVEAPFQDHGLGRQLVQAMAELAADQSVKKLYVVCERENDRMRHLAHKYGPQLMVLEA
jgi:GNAT superfamily N-acetyltransferase